MMKDVYYEKKKGYSIKPLHALYLIALFLMLMLLISAVCTRTNDFHDQTQKEYVKIDDDWRISPDGTEVLNLRQLGKYCDEDAKTLYLYCRVPELKRDSTLFYRSKDVYTSLYVDDEKIYETSVPESRFYNKSPGNLWNEVLLDKSYSGKLLTLRMDIVYDTKALTVDSFFLGDGVNIIRHFVSDNLFDLLLSMAMILMGLMYVYIDFVIQNKSIYMGHGMFFLGIYAFLLGVWCLLETNIVQFFVSDQRILQLCNNVIMITAMLPLFLFLDYFYKVLKKPVTLVLCTCNLIYIYVCVFCQFTGISDMHKLIKGVPVSVILSVVLFIGWVVFLGIECKRKKQDPLPVILQLWGIGCLMVSVTIEILYYTQGDLEDRAEFLRIGTFFFIIFFGVSNQIKARRLIVNGLQYNEVKNLAYTDGLTSVGNRAAYFEKLESYVGSNLRQVGIVFLDINNLKEINDTLGHEYGDELIKNAADIITKSYGEQGTCYRIGGDEFCVLIDSASPDVVYERATEAFMNFLKEANQMKDRPFKISIAQGFSICNEMTKEKLQQAVESADAAMYENKRSLKSF